MAVPVSPAPPLSPGAASAATPAHRGSRFLFVDNLRNLLISLVVVQHLSVTYGATGSWYYRDPHTDTLSSLLLTVWNGPGQAAGMGFFFLIAAYFTPRSYDRKGGWAFVRDRLARLGIPLVVYVLFIDPLVDFIGNGLRGSYWSAYCSYLHGLRGVTGPVWFVAVLLVFTLLYAAWRALPGRPWPALDRVTRLPGYGAILAYILALGVTTFFARIWWPVNVMFRPLNVSVGYLPQYASIFVLGILAYRGNWFSTLTPRMAKHWVLIAAFVYLLWAGMMIPVITSGMGRTGNDPGIALAGGLHWPSLSYAIWESFILVAACMGLLVLFRERLNWQGRVSREASASAYAVYLIHPLVLVPFCVAFQPVVLHPLIKFAVAVLITLPLCFVASAALRRVPALNRVL